MASVTPLESRPQARSITVQVLACVPAARDAVTLVLALPGTQRAPAPYLPGQFITLAFPAPLKTLYRSYSLCGDGRADTPWEITIKRRHDGTISNHLYRHARPGMLLQASLPQGSFTLPARIRPGMPIVFVAGGSGITPVYGMLRSLARLAPEQRPRIWLHYAYHSPYDAIYGRELAALDPQRQWLSQWHYVATSGQRLRVEQVVASLGPEAPNAEWYVCGPSGLKRSLEAVALHRGVPTGRIHAEVFASPARVVDSSPAGAGPARIRLAENGAVLAARPSETLLETLERYGYHPAFDCRAGACGTCRLRLLAGQVRHGEGGGLTAADRAAGYVLSCVAQPVGDVTVAAAGVPAAVLARRPARRALRLTLVAAAVGLFITAWSYTNHSPGAQAASSGSASSSNSNSSPFSPILGGNDDGGSNGGNNGGSSGQYPGGSVSTQPSPIVPSTGTGTS